MIVLHGIPNCDTVKKARAWLGERGVEHQFHDFKKAGVPPERLDRWIVQLGWEALINRRGTTWRKLAPAVEAGLVDAGSARTLALQEPSLIKRPVVEWGDGSTTVGFDASDWQARLHEGAVSVRRLPRDERPARRAHRDDGPRRRAAVPSPRGAGRDPAAQR